MKNISENLQFFSSCPNCTSKKINKFSKLSYNYIFKCHRCSLIFDVRIPSIDELQHFYEKYSYSYRKLCSKETSESFQLLLNKLEYYRKYNRILDVGCGQGDFLIHARKRGWETYGLEYSPTAVRLCKAEGLNVIEGNINKETFENQKFDVICSFEVFEHINEAPKQISDIHHKLRKGGLFYLTTPNFNALLRYLERDRFSIINYPEHLSYYTHKSLKNLAQSAGFQVLKIETTGLDIARLQDVFLRMARRSQPVASGRARIDQCNEVRALISRRRDLQFAKACVNRILIATGRGDTLKAWMTKVE